MSFNLFNFNSPKFPLFIRLFIKVNTSPHLLNSSNKNCFVTVWSELSKINGKILVPSFSKTLSNTLLGL